MNGSPTVAVIAIGRNEGDRLARCLASAGRQAGAVVYVDSDSSDRSVETATGLGAEVVVLEQDRPFTAARARNAGVARLRQMRVQPDFYQFVDGDCEVADGWVERALAEFAARPRRGRRLRAAARATPGRHGLQPPVRPRVGHARRAGQGVRRRRDVPSVGLRRGRRVRTTA